MTPLQMLRAILLRLSHPSPFLGDRALSVPSSGSSAESASPAESAPTPECFKAAFETVFLDDSGFVNLAADVSASRAKQVRCCLRLDAASCVVRAECLELWPMHDECRSLVRCADRSALSL